MKSRYRHSQYRGVEITIRWTELERDGWGPLGRRVTASYFVAARGVEFGAWQHFPQDVFISFDSAAAHALAHAHTAIDATAGA